MTGSAWQGLLGDAPSLAWLGAEEVLIALYTRVYTRKEYLGCVFGGGGGGGEAPRLPFPGGANLLKC